MFGKGLREFRKQLDVQFYNNRIHLTHPDPTVGSFSQRQCYLTNYIDFKEASRDFYKLAKKTGRL